MKNIVISLLIFAIMVINIAFSLKYLNKVSDDLRRLNDEIEQYITDNDWDKAYKSSIDFKEKWKNYSEKLKLFVDHQEMDNIEIELWKLPQYIKEENKEEALASVHALKFLIDHISELEKVTIQNIL
ncbi:DUF4363 family protein [Herbinix hemicellulosilytica]|uniref:Putative membrane protein n=2 Tax=Herbinix hemicellulosilytica TaxID=1564487 RepID=A0A0H5SET8_HERHM|nr:DUF4363 family protein [Herbinix hemicellulosilytica]CRZ33939.1 putative membrane protein [Herbinix hemicellulosilytica]